MPNQSVPEKELKLSKTSMAIIGQADTKTSMAIIGQAKTSMANSNINLNVYSMGHIPSGNVPNEAIDCCHLVGLDLTDIIKIDREIIYSHYNATKPYQKAAVDEKLNLYRNLLVEFLLKRSHYTTGSDLYQFPLDEFRTKVGKISVYGAKPGRQEELVKVVEKLQPQYTIAPEHKGSNHKGKVSFMELNFEMRRLVDLHMGAELLVKSYGDVDITDPSKVDITPIDIKSLKAYIKGNENHRSAKTDKMKAYRKAAETILLIAETAGGVLPQIIVESDYGRRYYKGPNLQTVSKVVRGAALGDHYEYDLNAAVYAIKLNICSMLTDKKFTYTSEYIEGGGKYKQKIRELITKNVFGIDKSNEFYTDRLSKVKSAITAIGFGASRSGVSFKDPMGNWQQSSLDDIFSYTITDDGKKKKFDLWDQNKVKCAEKFVNDPWIKNFIEEQTEMTKLIVKYMIDSETITKETHPFLVDGRNAINHNRAMAYVFQTTERNIMDTVEKFIEQSGKEVLLRVHDAIFTKSKVNMLELHVMLQEKFVNESLSWLGKKIICFEEEFSMGYSYDEEDESDIDAAWSKLTGVQHSVKPVKIYHQPTKKQTEGHYTDSCDYGQYEYDPENDPYVQDMNDTERKEHYRILGYSPNQLPSFLKDFV